MVSRRRVGALSESTVGLVPRVPSRMCWVGCYVAAFRFWDASVPETHRCCVAASRRGLAGVVEVRGCTRIKPSLRVYFVSEDRNTRLFFDAMQSFAFFYPCCKSDSIKLPLHLLGNDGGKRRARGTGSRERPVVLKGATSSTRSVGEVWCRAGLQLRPPDSEATACSGPRRANRVGFGIV